MRKPFEPGYWLYAKHDVGKQELTLHCSLIWAQTYATQIALRSIWANNALMEWTTAVRTAKDFPPLNAIQDDNTSRRLVCMIKNLSLTLNFNISLIWGNSQYHSTNFFPWSSNEIRNHLVGTQSFFILPIFLMYSDSYVPLQVRPSWQETDWTLTFLWTEMGAVQDKCKVANLGLQLLPSKLHEILFQKY